MISTYYIYIIHMYVCVLVSIDPHQFSCGISMSLRCQDLTHEFRRLAGVDAGRGGHGEWRWAQPTIRAYQSHSRRWILMDF